MSRLRHSTRLAAGALGFITTISVAFFIGSFLGDGSHTGTAGSGGNGTKTVPVKVNFPDGQLTPQQPVTVTAEVENTTGKTVTFHNVAYTVTTGAAGCNPAWFKVVPTGSGEAAELPWWGEVIDGKRAATLNYAPGTSPMVNNPNTGLRLTMSETGTDQSACEGAPVTLRFQLT